jgi:hypothetical protein
MSSRSRLILPFIFSLSALLLLAGCGSSSKTSTPPPSGSFSTASLTGTYVFSASGADGNGFFSTVGMLTANGSGGITGGVLDFNDPANLLTSQAIGTNSSYTVTSDGRGTAIIGTPSATFSFDFVLTSSSHGLVTRYDTAGTGSGTLDLVSSVTQAQLASSYAFDLVGVDVSGNSFASVGAYTLDSTGTISTGVQDLNDNHFAYPDQALTGSVVLSTSTIAGVTAPGIATLTTSTTFGSLTFDVFPIDATHMKFIETDAVGIMAGDAFSQSPLPSAGNLVFTASGVDSSGFALAAGGLMNFDGNLTVTSAIEDVNDDGTLSPAPLAFTGSFTALTGGRSTLTLTNFVGGSIFAAYPSSGGLQFLEIDDAGATGGVALPQTSTTLASGQGYGLNLSAVNANGEEDDIAEFTNTSGALAGLIDFNDLGALTFDQTFSGTYTADTINAGRGTIASSSFNLASYVVDGTTSLFVEMDNTQVGLGSYQQQTPTAKSNLAAAHLAVLSMKPSARRAIHHGH